MTNQSAPVKVDSKTKKALICSLLVDIKSISWPIEMRMVNALLKKVNNPDFWFFLGKRHKFISLRNLLASEGIIFSTQLEFHKQKTTLPKPSEVVLSPVKVGEDLPKEEKQLSLLDFIK